MSDVPTRSRCYRVYRSPKTPNKLRQTQREGTFRKHVCLRYGTTVDRTRLNLEAIDSCWVRCLKEGLFFADDLSARERRILERYAAEHPADVVTKVSLNWPVNS